MPKPKLSTRRGKVVSTGKKPPKNVQKTNVPKSAFQKLLDKWPPKG